ncbi:MAG TPA: alpha/beta hydrolase fold domain-containing protein [Mycobacterium sp.]|nr:alpha/beta hydrolase fold domain-containing protein [Mycobacterium sp.]
MLQGRLANPDCTLGTDPRSDPRMVAALAPFGLADNVPLPPLTADSPLDHRLAHVAETEELLVTFLNAMAQAAPLADGVTTENITIAGVDGNDIMLYISRPSSATSTLPCIVHTHGGGMAFGSATDLGYVRWRDNLAATGLVVVGVEFRNSAGKLGPHRYPAGLNDCASGVRWAAEHLSDLGVSHIVVSGESGGGHLTLAVAHKAKREGWLDQIAGFYAQCPFISNRYVDPPDELPSLREHDGYIFSLPDLAVAASIYDPDDEHAGDPACWPGYASEADLAGLPPHVISVNELDPLRDDGVVYYRRLVRAGVPTVGRNVLGTCHAGDMICAGAMPDVYTASLRDVSGFAKSLSPSGHL